MKKSLLVSFGSICAFTVAFGQAARAQTVDYGSLESMMGQPVTTSASGTPQTASDVAADMTIITADEIRQSGSRSIPQILSRVPGLDILQEGIDAFDVGVRGYNQPYQPRLLVLVDGRQVFIDDYSRTPWNDLPVNIDDIRQIEVVKGASTALFGSNATGGVINIITYSPIYDKNNVASVSLGTQNKLTGDATATVKTGSLGGVKISAGGLTENEFNTDQVTAERSAFVSPTQRYLAESSVTQVRPDLQATTEVTYSDGNDQYGIYDYAILPIRSTNYSLRGGFVWQSPYGTITSNNYFNHHRSEVDPGTATGSLSSSTNLIVSQLQDQFKVGTDNTFRAMFEYRHKELRGENGPTSIVETPQLNEDVFSAGGTWLWQITNKVSMTNALRIDHNEMEQDGQLEPANLTFYPIQAYTQSYDTVAANSGLVYKATDMDTFRALFGRGVQDPSLIESGFNVVLPVSGTMYDIEGNPNLKPTITENYELAYDRKVPQIFSVAKIAGSFEINRDLKATNPATILFDGSTHLLSAPINVGNSSGEAIEVELKGNNPMGFRWDGSYSYSTLRDAALVATTLGYAKSAPEHHFRLLVGYTTGPWEFDTNTQYVTSTGMLRSLDDGNTHSNVDTAGYASFSGRVGYKLTDNATVAVSGTNLTESQTIESPYPKVERQALITLTDKF